MSTTSLAPGLLLAAPRLGDPNFERTVVLLGRHEPQGSLGWVLNGRALGPVRELLAGSRLLPPGVVLPDSESLRGVARVGGPVAGTTGWLLYRRTPSALPGEIDVGDELAVTGDSSALAGVLRGHEPQAFRLVIGYAGWGPGQLADELAAGAWLPADVDAGLILETPSDALWDAAYHRAIGAAPGAFTSTRGGQA